MKMRLIILLNLVLFTVSASCSAKVAAPLDKSTASDKPGTFKNLGPQLAITDVSGSILFTTPSGQSLLYTVVRGKTAYLVAFDTKTKEVILNKPLEGTDKSWDLELTTDGWLYIAAGGGNFFRHLPGTQEITNLGTVLPGENLIWALSAGKNGEIFGGTYPGGKVFRYHPKDGFSDVGKGALVSGEKYVRSIAYDPGTDMIYAGIGAHAHLVELNPRTGAKKEILPDAYKSKKFITYLSVIKDDTNGDKLLAYAAPKTLIYNLRSKKFEGEVKVDGILVGAAIKSPTENKAYFTAGGRVYAWNLDDLSAPQVDHVATNAIATGWTKDGKLNIFNTRGELYELDLKKKSKRNLDLKVPALPLTIWYVGMGPDNKIWSGGNSQATYDISTGAHESYAGLSEAKSMAYAGSTVYIGVYPGGKLYAYNTASRWSANGPNPKLITQIPGQDRLFGMLAVNELNRVYVGTVPDYGKNGGALVELDVNTNKVKTYSNVVENQSIISLLYAGGMLYGGSSNRGGYGIDPTEKEAKLFTWDPVTNSKVSEIVPVKDAKSISCLTESPDKKIWGMAGGTLFIYDPDKKSIPTTKTLIEFRTSIGGWEPGALFFHKNGYVYGMDLKRFFRLNAKTLEMEILDTGATSLIMSPKGVFYYAKSGDLWEYKP